MGVASVPVDLFNPGQVFACLGLVEVAEAVCGEAAGGFDWSDPAEVRFRLWAAGEDDPVAAVLGFLARAELRAVAPASSDAASSPIEDVITTPQRPGASYPVCRPNKPDNLPAELRADGVSVPVYYWLDSTRRSNVKFWIENGGRPGIALLRDTLTLARPHLMEAVADPFALSEPQSSSFNFDWRRTYTPLNIGFSLNNHDDRFVSRGYPLTEILASIGVTDARPVLLDREDGLLYRYGVIAGERLPPMFLRAALGGARLPFPMRTFRMFLDWPSKKGTARCITHVTEEERR